MKNKILSLFVSFFAFGCMVVYADLPFRNHRYDAFKALKVTPENIVFMGNSITNMHEWRDAFDNPLIVNRGVSGGLTQEMINVLENVVSGRPRKLFLMIGTNDLGNRSLQSPVNVCRNIGVIVERVKRESPATKIYVQSILPSNSGIRTLELLKSTNGLIREMCKEKGVDYVDLWTEMMDIVKGAPGGLSLDHLHPTAQGYRVWCKKIAPLVGDSCIYPDDAANNFGGMGGSYGMRCSSMAMAGVKQGDIVFIGDEMVHGAEWHELLRCSKVKNRGTAWGYPGPDLATMLKYIEPVFVGRDDNGEPAKVALYAGTADLNNPRNSLDAIEESYRKVVDAIREKAPNATIYLQAILPRQDAQHNSSRVEPFNRRIEAMAERMSHVEFVDIYTPLVENGVASKAYFNGDYVYAMGYVKIATLLAQAFNDPGVVAITEAEAKENYELHSLRATLGNAISKVLAAPVGDKPGCLSVAAGKKLRRALKPAYRLIKKNSLTQAEVEAEVIRLEQAMKNAFRP